MAKRGEHKMSGTIPDPIWPILAKIEVLLVMDGYPGSGHYASFGAGDPSTSPASGDQYSGFRRSCRR